MKMMTKKLLSCAMATVMLALSACTAHDEQPAAAATGSKATFTATIWGQPQTRAYNQVWESGDAIGITATTGATAYTNVKYTTAQADGSFAAATAGSDIYYQDNGEVTFTAYYPWNDLSTAATIPADMRIQSQQKSFDFLWAQATGSKAAPHVAFTFAHRMSKVVMTLKKGADISFDELQAASLWLDGCLHVGEFDVATGQVTATPGTGGLWQFAGNTDNPTCNAPVSADASAQTLSYTLIVLPQVFTAGLPFTAALAGRQSFGTQLDFSAANANAGDASAANAWVAGRQYNISVTLHKTAITVDGCTINPWEGADGGNFDAR